MEMKKEVKIINLDDILPNRFQPRIQFNEKAILELSESIKEHGVIQPIVVRKIGDKYEIIAGERRYKASVLAGKTTIPAIITTLDDKDSAEIALIENVQREDLTPIEEAISYKKILDMGYLNQVALADKLGKTQSTIANKIRLLNLSEDVQEALLNNQISERHARSLLKLNEDNQTAMLKRIISERLTVRKTDEEIKKILEGSTLLTINKEESEDKFEEILEIETKEEKGEEKIMPENIGMPTGSIIEPIEETKNTNVTEPVQNPWQQTVTEVPSIEISKIQPQIDITPSVSTVNPGFMDIGKIENEAQDIFKPEPTLADIDMLLTRTEVEPTPEPISPMAPVSPIELENTNPIQEPSRPAGKFFNMFNFSEMEQTAPVEDLEQQEVNMDFAKPQVNDTFMFNFNPLESQSTPVVEQPQDINSAETFDNISAFNPIPLTEKSVVEQNVQPTPVVETLEEINPFSFGTVEQPSIVSETNVEDVESTFEPFQPYTLNDNEEFTLSSNNMDTIKAVAFINNEVPSVSPMMESVEPGFNIREVVRELRNCSANLERLGYKVELDELDLENVYQATFKISKIDE